MMKYFFNIIKNPKYYYITLLRRIHLRIINIFRLREKNLQKLFFRLDNNLQIDTSIIHKIIIENYRLHRFDLLGSGWLKWSVTDNIKNKYETINWHIDIKSGFQWDSSMWYKDCLKTIGVENGIDIKVPWELSRLQHLPQMALYSLDKGEKDSQLIYDEINYQVCDFIENNPVRYGVNWACPMDVGIRMVNILLTYDIIQSRKEINIDSKILLSAYTHAKFICQNLEYTKIPNNHYLSNICSLIIISSYLNPSTETISWLAFGLQELVKEVKKQFYRDGVNFESSTSYHRLSTEMIIYTMAYIRGLSDCHIEELKRYKSYNWKYIPFLNSIEKQEWKISKGVIELPDYIIDIVTKSADFISYITKPDNTVPQFGDNDSGRFIRLTPTGELITNKEAQDKYVNLSGYINKVKYYGDTEDSLFWDENYNVHKSLLAIFSGLFHDDSEYKSECEEYSIEYNMIKAIVKVPYIRSTKKTIDTACLFGFDINYKKFSFQKVIEYHSEYDLISNLKYKIFNETGIFIFKGDNLFLAINYGREDIIKGGHSHNDKLSYELTIESENITVDPGTYVYSSDPILRKKFRSNKAHQVIIVDEIEQNNIDKLFFSDIQCSGYLLRVDNNLAVFLLEHEKYIHIREFVITSKKVIVNDYCNKDFRYPDKFRYYSSGYGKLEKVN